MGSLDPGNRAFLLLVLSLGISIRLFSLSHQPIDDHEIISWSIATETHLWDMAAAARRGNTPPFYHLLLFFWTQIFGDSVWALRSLSALFGSLSLGAIYLAGKKIFSARTGLFAAAFMACCLPFIEFSQIARSASLLVFLCTGCLIFWPWLEENRSWGRSLTFGLLALLASCTHYFGLILYASFLAHLGLVCLIDRRKETWKVLAKSSIGLVFCLPLLCTAVVPRVLSHERYWAPAPSWRSLAAIAGYYFDSYLFMTASAAIAIAVLLLRRRRLRAERNGMHLSVVLLLFVGIATLKSTVSTSVWVDRYFSAAYPIGILLLARLFVLAPLKRTATTTLVFCLFVNGLYNILLWRDYYRPYSKLPELTQQLESFGPKATVFLDNIRYGILSYFKKNNGLSIHDFYCKIAPGNPIEVNEVYRRMLEERNPYFVTFSSETAAFIAANPPRGHRFIPLQVFEQGHGLPSIHLFRLGP